MAELLNSINRHHACSSRPYDFKKWNIITADRTGTLILKVHQTLRYYEKKSHENTVNVNPIAIKLKSS